MAPHSQYFFYFNFYYILDASIIFVETSLWKNIFGICFILFKKKNLLPFCKHRLYSCLCSKSYVKFTILFEKYILNCVFWKNVILRKNRFYTRNIVKFEEGLSQVELLV